MAKTKPDKRIQTGKTLPRYNSYHPQAKMQTTTPGATSLPEKVDKKASWQHRLLKVLGVFILCIFVAFIFIVAWDARNISAASQKMFGSANILQMLDIKSLKGSETGRVNLLLVGYSVDDPGHPAATLTDSLILLSMSTSSHTGYMLSIPRDLYVNIPGHGYAKINEAYQDGGIGLLEQIINQDFQQPIDYYAIINYSAVRDTVNALGGITVDIKSSDPQGLYDPNISPQDGGPLKLSNGPQQLDGQTALNLTRARGDAYGSYGFNQADFDRTQHQRQVLAAIKARLGWSAILIPWKNAKLLNAVASNVKTDIQADEIRPLFGLFNSIPESNLQSISLRDFNGHNYLASYTTPYGQSALIPVGNLDDYSAIDQALQSLK